MQENDAEGPSASLADELVRRARGHDSDAEVARAELAHAYKPLVISIAAPMVRDKVLREDVIQAGYLGLYVALDRFEPLRAGAFSTFARKYILGSAHRAARRRRDEWGTIITNVAAPADAELEKAEALRLIHAFVGSLPKRLQHVVRRVFWDGATQTEVAAELGISKMMVSKLIADVRRRGQFALTDIRGVSLAA